MKYLFASDVHGSVFDMYTLAERIGQEKPDKVVFLGDFCGRGEPKLFREAVEKIKAPIVYVDGNCDEDYALERYGLASVGIEYVDYAFGRRIYCTHGHIKNRLNPPDYLTEGDLFVYGHLHVPFIEKQDGVWYLNCGSMARPRGSSVKTYAVVEDGVARIKDGEYGDTLTEVVL
ncbi:MAG: YfcE family phosphodiesterase [Clostridia bacterium]|nr:YfcE family phosphodiesterase [Clostridia bacterium]